MKFFIATSFMFLCYASLAYPIKSSLGSRSNFIEDDSEIQNPYITEGLVAMWHRDWNEGFQEGYNPNATAWIDCINGIALPLTSAMYWTDEGLFMPKSSYSEINIPESMSSLGENFFVSIVFRRASTGSSTCTVFSIGKYIFFRVQDNSKWIYDFAYGSGCLKDSSPNDALQSFGWNSDSFYINGVTTRCGHYNFEFSSMNNAGKISLGPKQYPRDLVIGAVLVYSRRLTEEEIAYNYLIDQERFGL